MMNLKNTSSLLIFLFSSLSVFAQDKDLPSISERINGLERFQGFFNFFYDDDQDKILMQVDRLDTEFLYVNSLPAGIGSNDIGLDRGQLGRDRIVKFQRFGRKILLIQPNYRYRAVSDNPSEKKAVELAFAKSVLWGFPIEAKSGNSYLIELTEFIIRDVHDVSGRLKRTGQGSYKLDKSRSALFMENTKSFPENSEFEALLTFTGNPEGAYIRSVSPTPEAVTVRQRHSFIKLPDDDYEPRKFDPRAGLFGISYMDYATPISEEIVKRFISRHRLKKKDPQAEVSEAVEPIVYYVDPGAPEPIRSALIEGASWWNQAFEAIGYKDAFQVKLLPEDADPMDVRYNMIQWVHRSTRGWSYGSSVRDPRTGEIIKGHVTLGSLRVRQDFLIAEGLLAPYKNGEEVPKKMEEMALARIRQLSAHEVGHTLGLAHNFYASVNDRASVMDYPHPLVKINDAGEIDLTEAYDTEIGEWDKVAIAYGYQDFPEGTDEANELDNTLNEAFNKGLRFMSDRDARPQGGAHASAHLWDNGKDPADELSRVLRVRQIALNNFSEKNIRTGEPMATLEEVLVPVYFFHRYQVEAAVKLIGGMHYNYSLRGDGLEVTEIVESEYQRKALGAVLETIQPSTLTLSSDIISRIPPRAMGYSRNRETFNIRTGVTFDPISAAETAADLSMGLLFHPDRASRLVEFHARDRNLPGLREIIERTIDASWKSNRVKGLQAEIQRVTEAVVLQNLIKLASSEEPTNQVRSIAFKEIDELKVWIETQKRKTTDPDLNAHYDFALAQINEFQQNPNKGGFLEPLSPPAGSPIGTFETEIGWD